jgi:hypothetical protein
VTSPAREEPTYSEAIDIVARRAAADAVAQDSAKHQVRSLPKQASQDVHRRWLALATELRPTTARFERAWDVVCHGKGDAA